MQSGPKGVSIQGFDLSSLPNKDSVVIVNKGDSIGMQVLRIPSTNSTNNVRRFKFTAETNDTKRIHKRKG
jgi:hypothetical protein